MSGPERRRAPRFDVTFRLVCDDGDGFGNASVVNLSESGALVQSAQEYELGDVVMLVPLGSAGEILFDLPAQVVRIVQHPSARERRYGLQFFDLDERRAEAVTQLCRQMPPTDDILDGELPEGGGPSEGGEPHARIRARFRDHAKTPRWARRPFQ